MNKDNKKKIIIKFGKSEKNVGCVPVQIALLTDQIEILKNHFNKNKKDLHSKRGFMKKISSRKKLLTYLKNKDFDKYNHVISDLKIRK